MIDLVIVEKDSLPVFQKRFSSFNIDTTLLLGFFSALKSFASSIMQDDSEIKWIHIGRALLDFDSIEFDEFGRFDILVLSHGLDPSTSHSLVDEIAEQFAIFLEEHISENPELLQNLSSGKMPNMKSFESELDILIESSHNIDLIDMNLNVTIPNNLFRQISSMIEENTLLDEIYAGNERLLLEQILSDYATSPKIVEDIKKHFKNIN